MTPMETTRLTSAIGQRWYVPMMKKPPSVNAATSGVKLGPGRRWHCSGRASITDVINVSRRPSSASGR
jgi:hypothetical protein